MCYQLWLNIPYQFPDFLWDDLKFYIKIQDKKRFEELVADVILDEKMINMIE